MNIHPTFPAFESITARECRLIHQNIEIPASTPVPNQEQQKKNIEGQVKTSEELNKRAGDIAQNRVKTTQEGLQNFAKTNQEIQKIQKIGKILFGDMVTSRSDLPQQPAAKQKVESQQKLIAQPTQKQITESQAYKDRMDRLYSNIDDERQRNRIEEFMNNFPPAVQYVLATGMDLALVLFPNLFRDQPQQSAETPQTRLERQGKQEPETNKTFEAARKSVVQVPAAPPLVNTLIPVRSDRALCETALQNVHNELENVNALTRLAGADLETFTKALTEPQRKQFENLLGRRNRLEEMRNQLEGWVKIAGPANIQAAGKEKEQNAQMTKQVEEQLEKSVPAGRNLIRENLSISANGITLSIGDTLKVNNQPVSVDGVGITHLGSTRTLIRTGTNVTLSSTPVVPLAETVSITMTSADIAQMMMRLASPNSTHVVRGMRGSRSENFTLRVRA